MISVTEDNAKSDLPVIHWYPGHMTKAKRAMEEDLKKVDLVIELLDARAVRSSENPDIASLAAGKYRLIVLNKADLADDSVTNAWIEWFKARGLRAVPLDSRSKNGPKSVLSLIPGVCAEKIEKARKKGILNVTVRAMVAGIPNAGKSTFINALSGRSSLETGDKPGVTRGNQWIRLKGGIDLLDTPGILWPRFDDPLTGVRLAYVGSVSRDVIEPVSLSRSLLRDLKRIAPGAIAKRYGVDESEENIESLLTSIAVRRGCMKKGGIADTEKASTMILDDFRTGKFGKISLERPDDE